MPRQLPGEAGASHGFSEGFALESPGSTPQGMRQSPWKAANTAFGPKSDILPVGVTGSRRETRQKKLEVSSVRSRMLRAVLRGRGVTWTGG